MWKVKQINMAGETIYRVYREFEKDGVEYTQYAAYGKQPTERATEEEAQNIADHLNRKEEQCGK